MIIRSTTGPIPHGANPDGANSMVVGTDEGSTGTVTIDGANSSLENKGDVSIGYSGDGTMTISNGGSMTVDADIIRVGRNEGGVGTLTITDSGSTLTATNVADATIYVGYGGTGTVNIQKTATMTVGGTNIGGQDTGDGTLNIDGSGTTADLSTTVVGDEGAGTMNVTNTAAVTTDALTIGNAATGNGTLNINTNAVVRAGDDTSVGEEEGSQGEVTVDGTGSALNISGDLKVGASGDGTMTVSNNGTVSNQDGTVGAEETGTGDVEVTGQGSIWHSTGELVIGEQGTGEVTVDEGGSLRVDGDLTIGKQAGSEGTLTLDGPATTFTYSGGDVTIGSSGTGTMNVQNGVFIDLGGNGVTLGDEEDQSDATGDGTLNVTSADTVLKTGDLTVGGKGTGELNINDGATVVSGDGAIGDEADSSGTATVSGPGAIWTATDMTVGGKGDGTLNIEDGGALTVNSSEMVIGDETTGTGVVTLSGDESQLSFKGELQVGEQGTGLLAVQGDASFVAHAVNVGDMSGSTGTLNVDGDATSMEIQTDFNVGEQGSGTLNVTNGAHLLNDGDATLADMIGSDATATIDNGSSWGINGSLSVGHQDTATLTISAGSAVAVHDAVIGDESVGLGTVNLDGSNSNGASLFQYSASLAVGNMGTGHLNITHGGEVAPASTGAGVATIAATPDSVGSVSVDGAGSHFEAKSLSVGGSSTTPGGQGTMTLTHGGTAHVSGAVTTGSNGSIDATGGAFTIGSASTLASVGQILVNDGGSLGGSGTVTGNLEVANGGVVAPGDPATLTVNGNYTADAGSEIDLQIGGTSSADYDHLVVTNLLTINSGAKLELDFIDGFAPTAGEVFDLFIADSVDGTFSSIDVQGLASPLDYTLSSISGGISLTAQNSPLAAPEPSTWRPCWEAWRCSRGARAGRLGGIQRIGDDTSATDWNQPRRMGVNTLGVRACQHGDFPRKH